MKKKNSIITSLLLVMAIITLLITTGCSDNKDNSSDNKTTTVAVTTQKETPAETTTAAPVFGKVAPSYFDDALFIGNSLTVGLEAYGKLTNSTFFCNVGMSVYSISSKKIEIKSMGTISLDNLLSSKKFGKVYVMLGINELGYNFDMTVSKYTDLIKKIQKYQPDAIIYIQGLIHVTKSHSQSNETINNPNINKFNKAIKKLADNKSIFYLDLNELFDDKSGALNPDFSGDGVHLDAAHYCAWGDWLAEHALIK